MIIRMPKGYADSVYTLRNNASPGNVLLRTPSQKNGSEEGIYESTYDVGILIIESA